MNEHIRHLSDYALMSQHRFYALAKAQKFQRFPNAADRHAFIEEILLKRIPAEHTNEILKLIQHDHTS